MWLIKILACENMYNINIQHVDTKLKQFNLYSGLFLHEIDNEID